MRQVVPHPLWIGHAGDGRDFIRLDCAGIRALVQLAFEESVIQPPRDLLYLRIPLLDGVGNRADCLALAIRAVSELLSRRVPTLVCCGAGMSRSPCIVAAALAMASDLPPEVCLGMATSGTHSSRLSLWCEVCELVTSWQSDPGPQP